MVKQHLKRLASPNTWPIPKKTLTFVARPLPGPNNKDHHVPIAVFLRDLVHLVETKKESKFILHNKDCLIDGVVARDDKQPIGFLGVVSLPKVNKSYRLSITKKNKLVALEINDKEAATKICKIMGKTSLGKEKTQLNCTDGRNILVAKDTYKVGDSVLIELPSQKIINHFPLAKDAIIFLESGNHVGKLATVHSVEGDVVTLKIDDVLFKTKKKYAVVVGKEKSTITVQ